MTFPPDVISRPVWRTALWDTTAKALNLTIPPRVLSAADEMIE
jgi:hypothetical protein